MALPWVERLKRLTVHSSWLVVNTPLRQLPLLSGLPFYSPWLKRYTANCCVSGLYYCLAVVYWGTPLLAMLIMAYASIHHWKQLYNPYIYPVLWEIVIYKKKFITRGQGWKELDDGKITQIKSNYILSFILGYTALPPVTHAVVVTMMYLNHSCNFLLYCLSGITFLH